MLSACFLEFTMMESSEML